MPTSQSTLPNPFVAGDPVQPIHFVGRRYELTEIAECLVSHGQSSAIIGEPKSGKTSLLLYLKTQGIRDTSYAEYGHGLHFSYIDCQALAQTCDWTQFWREALRPFEKSSTTKNPDQAYRKAYERNFDRLSLEDFLSELQRADQRLVLLLDELDGLLQCPRLRSAAFLGGLRTLTSLQPALALVTASRMPLEYFHQEIRDLIAKTSPYFNFARPILLGAIGIKDILDIMKLGDEKFTGHDRRRIREWAGGHPYLLQAAASALWQLRSIDKARARFYERVKATLKETWALWTPAARCAFTLAALPGIEGIGKVVYKDPLLRIKDGVTNEFVWLEKHGFIIADTTTSIGWQVRPAVFTWWLGDEIRRIVHGEGSYEEWLRENKWEGLLTSGEKKRFNEVARTVGEVVKDTVKSFIEAAAQGLGKTATGNA